jgi:hypothetical protein
MTLPPVGQPPFSPAALISRNAIDSETFAQSFFLGLAADGVWLTSQNCSG